MERRLRWIAASLLVVLTACCGTAPLPRATFFNFPLQDAYPTWRWIGIKRDLTAPCPPARGWRVEPLLDLRRLPAEAQRQAAGLGLDAYCLYENPRAGQGLPLATIRALGRAEPDPMALVLAAGDDLRGLTSPAFETDFAQRAGRAVLPNSGGRPRVRLVLLDTQPTGNGVPALPASRYNSPHGYALANIAGRLTSNGDGDGFYDPAADVRTRLAMPYLSYDPTNPGAARLDLARGGFVGSIGGLAQAVVEEVTAWETRRSLPCTPADRDCGRAQHLVLNLSLGWDGEKFSGGERYVADMQAAVQAVHKTLELAACRGALVVAAAGNRSGGPGAPTGPVLPAGWEGRVAEPYCPELAGRPFIYAAGGVQAQSYPLASSRLQGLPRLSAYGDHAVVKDRHRMPTPTLTGTSVATVVVSSAAALVWQHRPELTADQVMELLYQSGDTMKDASGVTKLADFYYSPAANAPAPEAHRISLCRALSTACPNCSPATCAEARPDGLAQRLSVFHPVTTIDGTVMSVKFSPQPPCKAPALYHQPADPLEYPCPFEQLPSMTDDPETTPQPGADPCPNCTLTSDSGALATVQAASTAPAAPPSAGSCTLRIEIASDWSTPLRATNLEINQLNGLDENKPAISYAIDLDLTAGQSIEVHGLDLMGGQTATLNFVSQPAGKSPMSIESPVYIDCPPADSQRPVLSENLGRRRTPR
jgi:hypothetical protein